MRITKICFPILLVLLIACGLAVSTAEAAEIPWADPDTIDGSFNGATDVTAADIDGDGDLDVLAAAKAAHDITWWENTAGDGSAWTEYAVDDDFEDAVSVQAADIDGDGNLDILAAGHDTDTIVWWESDGSPSDGGWTQTTIDSDFTGARAVYAADIDGDGDLDVLGVAEDANDVTWWENTAGDGSAWSEDTIDGAFTGAYAVTAADLDQDGDLDILAAQAAEGGIAWWENTAGDGSAWSKTSIDSSLNGAKGVLAADVDGDGDLDVLGASHASDTIGWWENTAGDGSAWTAHAVARTLTRPAMFTLRIWTRMAISTSWELLKLMMTSPGGRTPKATAAPGPDTTSPPISTRPTACMPPTWTAMATWISWGLLSMTMM